MIEQADPRILILDDDAGHAASVSVLLKANGYDADTLSSPAAAFQQLRTGRYRLLILDLNMPGISGLDVLEFLANQKMDVKTIVVSGESSVSTVTPILRLGAYDFVPKPYNPQQLLTSVANAAARCKLEDENRAMAAQAEADHKLHSFLVDASPDLIYMLDQHGRFSFANHRLWDFFSRSPEDMSGRPWHELLGDKLSRELRYRFNERRTGERATRNHEFDYQRSGEQPRILEVSATGLYENFKGDSSGRFTGTYGVLRDVTESRRIARELEQNRRKFQGLFMNSPDAVYIARMRDGRLMEANARLRDMQQQLEAAEAETDAFVFANAEERSEFIAGLQGSPDQFTMTVLKEAPDGPRYFELNARALSLDEEPCVLATLRDRTDERRAERDRLNLQNQLQQASKMEAIGQLAGGIAHDFNNILASIIGYTELVQSSRKRISEEMVDSYLGEVVTAGHRARDLISQMLTFTRANRGDPQPVDLSEAISDVSRMLRAAIPSNIDVQTEFAEGLPMVYADPVQLQQIIINLLVNARDAIEGEGLILVHAHQNEQKDPCAACGKYLTEPHIVLAVSDTGHGISEAVRGRIFEMYFTTREPGKGTGIGLWLINNLIHEYNGHVTVNSAPGKGTTFEVHLPLVRSAATTGSAAPAADEAASGRVVIVDDEVSVGNYMGEVLRDNGFDVIVFNESPAALRYLEERGDQIAALLTDQAMPTLTGAELTERARQLLPELPIALITGYTRDEDLQKLRALGINQVLKKPFRIDELVDAVRKLLTAGPGVAASSHRELTD